MKIRKLEKEEYPKGLHEIPQPPDKLYLLGELPKGDYKYLCVVGSRKNTSYGRDACEKIIAGLKGYPIVIVSGFAMGIDTIAHKKALEVGLKTIVFPGSGLSKETIYPRINYSLIEKILVSGGCFLSEFDPDFRATPWSFPMRNRLMVGISDAVLIIEAEEKSGTLITARLAAEYNRDLLAVPGSIFSSTSCGTNKQIKLGATPVVSSEDVLEALHFEVKKDEIQQKKLFDNLSSEEKLVVNLLHEPMSKDDLIKNMNMSIAKANTILSIMEIKEIIKEEFGEFMLK